MATGRGYKAKYDYVELTVEPVEGQDQWRLVLRDQRYAERVEHDETFDTAEEAKDAALAVAQHHINVQHNDTLLVGEILKWREL